MTCIECGNDDACEGYRVCSDCLELTGDPDEAARDTTPAPVPPSRA